MAPQVPTLDELRTFATDHGLELSDEELVERIGNGSTNKSMHREQYLIGFLPELNKRGDLIE